jgi:circadian clock protein KaiC
VDRRPVRSAEQAGTFDLSALLAGLDALVRRAGARTVVFDGLDVVLSLLPDQPAVRRELYRIHDWLGDRRLTGIVTGNLLGDEIGLPPHLAFLPFLADTVVRLHLRLEEPIASRSARVVKSRGARHSADAVPLLLGPDGLRVLAPPPGPVSHRVSTRRLGTGLAQLDRMLEGGYFEGSATLISGAPGTSKTTLAAAFADAACRRGERVLFVSFDESAEQLVRNLTSVGIRLRGHRRAGLLAMHSALVHGQDADRHVEEILDQARAMQARHLVIDPLSALSGTDNPDHSLDATFRLVDHAKREGITIVATSLLEDSSLREASAAGVSTVADTWIHLSYHAHAGERNRLLTIVKSRGTGHSNQVRELQLSHNGLQLSEVYTAGGEVLLGTLRWEREQQQREEARLAAHEAELARRTAELQLAEARAGLERARQEVAVREAALAREIASREAAARAVSRLAEGVKTLRTRGRPRKGGPA